MIISIGGTPGSGKSSLAKMLAEKLDYRHYYIGGMRRKMAEERGMTLEELNALGEKEVWTDREVDEYQKRLGETEDNFIIEGRTSFFFIPHSLKIFISVDPRVGAQRVYGDLSKDGNERNEGTNLDSLEAVLRSHKLRIASDRARYKKYYNIDVYDLSQYDYIQDTTNLTIPAAFDQLYAYVKMKHGIT